MPIGIRVQAHCKEDAACRIRKRRPKKRVVVGQADNRLAPPYAYSPSGRSKVNPRPLPFFEIAVISMLCLVPTAALAMPLSQTEFTVLATRCAPMVSTRTLEAVARTESGLDPLVLHDNTTGQKDQTGSPELAVVEAEQWIGRGDSVDIGLMQINATNLPALDMTVVAALDPCASLAGGAAILKAAYDGEDTPADQQAALLMALSRYNTGTPFQGIMNGYARTVLKNAGKAEEALPILLSTVHPSLFVDPNAPPAWNVSAAGAYAQIHGASWLISLAPSVSDQRLQARPMRPSAPADAIASK
jgi:type IV secretion system protein VirB1